jgi:hypothetical protein
MRDGHFTPLHCSKNANRAEECQQTTAVCSLMAIFEYINNLHTVLKWQSSKTARMPSSTAPAADW